jgi:penicillin-binding protein 2
VWENGRHGGSAAQLARPVFDYWLMQRKKNPIRPEGHQISGGLMTAGIKPGELPSGSGTAPASSTTDSQARPANSNTHTAQHAATPTNQAAPAAAADDVE